MGPGTGYFLERAGLPAGSRVTILDPNPNVLALFGPSVLGTAGSHTWLSRRVLGAFNRRGAFDNLGDSEAGLREILAGSSDHVELETTGSIAVFAASGPRVYAAAHGTGPAASR